MKKNTITKHKKIANGRVLLDGSISLSGKEVPTASRTSRRPDTVADDVVVPAIVPGYASRTGATIAKYLPEILRAKELIAAHVKELGILGQSSLRPEDAFGNPIQMAYAESQFSTVIRALHGKPDFKDIPAPDSKFRYDLIEPLPQDTKVARALRHLGYIHYLEQPYPIFVYSSLRTGQANHEYLSANPGLQRSKDNEVSVWGEAFDMSLYNVQGFPYAVRNKKAKLESIVGEVIFTTRNEEGYLLRRSLDSLEGFVPGDRARSQYKRELVRILPFTDGVETLAWIYLTTNSGLAKGQLKATNKVLDGDWLNRRRS